MKNSNPIQTGRLILRPWQEQDYTPFVSLNADPAVMEYFPSRLSERESHAMADKIKKLITQKGWGFWAAEEKESGKFIGFVGLNAPAYDLPFNPCVEIGWRLAKDTWGKGYATEAARASLQFAFENLDLDEVVSFTTITNLRSRAVMERLGFANSGEDFDHPLLEEGHPLQKHVLYKLSQKEWRNRT
ncbi:MAG: GNAT family N-acetyltransferase [Sneathiella sp.]